VFQCTGIRAIKTPVQAPAGERDHGAVDRFLPKGDSRSDPRLEPAAPTASPGRVRRSLQPASTTPRTTPGQPRSRHYPSPPT
jgi:hypothetical protein